MSGDPECHTNVFGTVKNNCTRELFCFSDLAKSLRSFKNRKWYTLCSSLFFLISYMISQIAYILFVHWATPWLMELMLIWTKVGKNSPPGYNLFGWKSHPLPPGYVTGMQIFQLGIDDPFRSITLGPIPNILGHLKTHECCAKLHTFLKFIQVIQSFVNRLL